MDSITSTPLVAQDPTQNEVTSPQNDHPEAVSAYEVCKVHDFPKELCPYCEKIKVKELENEVIRLKNGDFTSDELQNLCHNLSQSDANAFGMGCFEYQLALFGPEHVRQLYLRVRGEYLKLFQCEACGSIPEDDGRMWHGRNCSYKPGEFGEVQDLMVRKTGGRKET